MNYRYLFIKILLSLFVVSGLLLAENKKKAPQIRLQFSECLKLLGQGEETADVKKILLAAAGLKILKYNHAAYQALKKGQEIALATRDIEALYQLGIAMDALNFRGGAMQCFTELLALAEKNQNISGLLKAARGFSKLQYLSKANSIYQLVYEANQKNYRVLIQVGIGLAKIGYLNKAFSVLQQAKDIMAEAGEFKEYFELSRGYILAGNFIGAYPLVKKTETKVKKDTEGLKTCKLYQKMGYLFDYGRCYNRFAKIKVLTPKKESVKVKEIK